MQNSGLIKKITWSHASQTVHPNMTEQEHDLNLIRRIGAGDEDAMRELYAMYGQRLYAYALRITNDPATAEDVAQNSLVTAWQTASKFRGEGRVIAWLLGIVHHTAIKSIRIPKNYSNEMLAETVPENQPTLEEQIQSQEKKRWIKQGLQSLSSEHRAVLELIFYQELSLNETAEVLRCPIGTVKSRLSYARKQLQGVLARTQEHL